MATQTGTTTSIVIILVFGAGMIGHMILGKATLSDVIANVQEILLQGQKGDPGGYNSDHSSLQAQIVRLAQEVQLDTVLCGGRVGVFLDIMYVTKKSMDNAISSFNR